MRYENANLEASSRTAKTNAWRPALENRKTTPLRAAAFIFFLLSLTFFSAGCGALGAFYGIFIDPLIPPKTIKAQHSFKDKTVMVWVEPMPGAETTPHLRRLLNSQLIDNLDAQEKEETLKALIPYDRLAEYRLHHPDYTNRPLTEIAKHFQADEILSIVIEKCDLHHDAAEGYYNILIIGSAEVIQTADGARLWPTAQTRLPFTIADQPVLGQGENFETQFMERTAQNFAAQIGPWFYDHKEKK